MPAFFPTTVATADTITLTYIANPAAYAVNAPITNNTVSAVGGTVSKYTLVSGALPAGLSLDPANGTIYGTPTTTTPSPFTATITGTGPAGGGTVILTINIVDPPSNLQYSTNPATYLINTGIVPNIPTITGFANNYTVTTGSLPTGLSLGPTDGIITGIPTTAGRTNFTVTASGAGSSTSCVVTMNISYPVTVVYPASPVKVEMFSAFTITPAVTGNPNTFTYSPVINGGNFPSSCSFNTSTGAITGNITAATMFTISIHAENGLPGAGYTTTVTVSTSNRPMTLEYPAAANPSTPITLLVPSLSGPYSLTPVVSGGGAPNNLMFTYIPQALPPGMSINPSDGTITGTPLASSVGNTYTFAVQVSGAGGATTTATISIIVAAGPTVSPTIIYPNTGFDTTGSVSQLELFAGTAVSFVPVTSGIITRFVNDDPSFAGLSFYGANGVLSGVLRQGPTPVSSPAIPYGTNVHGAGPSSTATAPLQLDVVSPDRTAYPNIWGLTNLIYEGVPFSTAPYVIGLHPPTFAVTAGALPSSLSFDGTTGKISGTPSTGSAGTYHFTVTTSYPSDVTAPKVNPYTLVITAAPAPSPFLSFTLATGIVLQASIGPVLIPLAISGTVNSFSITAGTLPPGLMFNPTDGSINGTLTTAFTQSSYAVTITATGPSSTASATLGINTGYAPLIVYYPTASCDVGNPVTIAPLVCGFPTTWALRASIPSLPPGLSFNASNGQFTGTPTAPGTYTLIVQTSGQGVVDPTVSTIVLTVYPKVAVYYPPVLSVIPNQPFTMTPVAVRATLAYTTYTLTPLSGLLPPHVSFNTATGVLSGYLPDTYSFTIRITATGPGGTSDAVSITSNCPSAQVIAAYPVSPFNLDLNSINGVNIVSTTTGFPTTFVQNGTLPAGLTFQVVSSATGDQVGQLTGRPTTLGPFSFTIQASSASSTYVTTLSGQVI